MIYFTQKVALTQSLRESGLFKGYLAEERVHATRPLNLYYGLNISQNPAWEPIDQLDGILIARRVQDWNKQNYNECGSFYPYVAGIYNVFNSSSLSSIDVIKELELKKTQMWKKLIEKYNVRGTSISGVQMWADKVYWDCFQGVLNVLKGDKGVVNSVPKQVSASNPFEVIRVSDFPWNEITDVTLGFPSETRHWYIQVMYAVAEIAEAGYLKKRNHVSAKVSPERTEEPYDKYISKFMGILAMEQPTKFTRDWRPMDVTPYIGTEFQLDSRIVLSDDATTIRGKRLYKGLKSGGPFLRALKIATESARALGKTPVTIDGIDLYTGTDVKNLIRVSEDRLLRTGSRIIEEFAITPLKESVSG